MYRTNIQKGYTSMKYQIKKLEANNFDVFEIGKLKPRSYFIPYSDRGLLERQSVLSERYSSDMVTVLSNIMKSSRVCLQG